MTIIMTMTHKHKPLPNKHTQFPATYDKSSPLGSRTEPSPERKSGKTPRKTLLKDKRRDFPRPRIKASDPIIINENRKGKRTRTNHINIAMQFPLYDSEILIATPIKYAEHNKILTVIKSSRSYKEIWIVARQSGLNLSSLCHFKSCTSSKRQTQAVYLSWPSIAVLK